VRVKTSKSWAGVSEVCRVSGKLHISRVHPSVVPTLAQSWCGRLSFQISNPSFFKQSNFKSQPNPSSHNQIRATPRLPRCRRSEAPLGRSSKVIRTARKQHVSCVRRQARSRSSRPKTEPRRCYGVGPPHGVPNALLGALRLLSVCCTSAQDERNASAAGVGVVV
jgi:hypothetical protein